MTIRKDGRDVGPVDLAKHRTPAATVPGVEAEVNLDPRHHARIAAMQLGAADARARSAAGVLEALDRNQRDGMAQTIDTLIGEHRRIADVHATTALALAASRTRPVEALGIWAEWVIGLGLIAAALALLFG